MSKKSAAWLIGGVVTALLGALGALLAVPVLVIAAAAGSGGTGGLAPATVPGIDPVLLAAYTQAAASAPPACEGMRWSILAAIGQVESSQAAGHTISAEGMVNPPIIGVALDGSGVGGNVTAIHDSDHGVLDHDTVWDHAVGLLQFLPSTWASVGVDGNADTAIDPQNVYDVATTAMTMLCGSGRDLNDPAVLHEAIYAYNHAQTYVDEVLGWITQFDAIGAACPPVTTGGDDPAHLTPDALNLLRCGITAFPEVVSTGGWAPGAGHVSDSNHYTGRAIDFMVPGWDSPAGRVIGDRIAAWAYANRDAFGVTEIIWNATIRTRERNWTTRPYQHPCLCNDPNLQHLTHVHVSVAGNTGTYNPVAVTTGTFSLPVAAGRYTLTSRFGERGSAWSSGYHTGLDFAAPQGTPIVAVAAGTVTFAGWGGPYGWKTEITHADGTQTWYCHQSAQAVRAGTTVTAGQLIGAIGHTGNVRSSTGDGSHLHLEVRINGVAVDPFAYFVQRGVRP